MITNMWGIIEPYCDNEMETPEKMTLDERTLKYQCPHCKNLITIHDYEKMVDEVSKRIIEIEMNGEVADLTEDKWTTKGIRFRVFEYSPKKIKVAILNKGEVYKK